MNSRRIIITPSAEMWAEAMELQPADVLARFATFARTLKRTRRGSYSITAIELRGIIEAGEIVGAELKRRKRVGNNAGRKRNLDVPRCACGAMTLRRAQTRGHRCETQPDERDAKAAMI